MINAANCIYRACVFVAFESVHQSNYMRFRTRNGKKLLKKMFTNEHNGGKNTEQLDTVDGAHYSYTYYI